MEAMETRLHVIEKQNQDTNQPSQLKYYYLTYTRKHFMRKN